MEQFRKYTEAIKGKAKVAKVLKDEWTPRMIVQQYVIGINKQDEKGCTILHEICREGDVEMLKEYLHLPIDINAKSNNGHTPLMYASIYGKEKCVEILCKNENTEINAQAIDGNTALILASRSGTEKCVEILCKMEDIEINTKNKFGLTALMRASGFGYEKCVEILCKMNDIDVANAINVDVMAKDITAMWHQRIKVSAKDRDGRTALMHASIRGKEKCAEILCKMNDTEVSVKDNNGYTALMHALDNGRNAYISTASKNGYEKCAEILRKTEKCNEP